MKPDTPHQPPTAEPAPSTDPTATEAWLAGLAGRPGAGPDHREGAALRDALAPPAAEEEAQPADWASLVQAARHRRAGTEPVRPSTHTTSPESASSTPRRTKARGPLVAAGVAAMGTAALIAWVAHRSTEPEGAAVLRGVGAGVEASSPNVWRTPDPAESSRQLAERLRALGASVSLVPTPQGVDVQVHTTPQNLEAVNAVLMSIEAGLDGQGSAVVRVVVGASAPGA